MALAAAVQGATRPEQVVTWTRADGTPENLTGATLAGKIQSIGTGVTRAIAGTLTVTTAASGIFTWNYHADDVADDGSFQVQFTATFGSNPTPARTLPQRWTVHKALPDVA
jgi:hypothetical protein